MLVENVPKSVAGLYKILLFFTLSLCVTFPPFLTLPINKTHKNVVRKVWYLNENLHINNGLDPEGADLHRLTVKAYSS